MKNIIIHSCPSLKLARSREKIITDYKKITISTYLKNTLKNRKYFIYTHGCQANYRDSEIYMGLFKCIGLKKTDDIKKAHIVLINTCAVRENAENKVLGEIGNLKILKKNNGLTIIVAGCMSMEEVIVDELIKTFPHVDIILGTHDIAKLPLLLEEHFKSNKRIIDVNSGSGYIHENLPSVRDSTFKAFVNISYGCNKFCTYCIVPYTRGRERSRDPKDIINECKKLVSNGYLEITLLGQNVDSYGKDLKKKYSFAQLLEEIAKLKIPRLSFLTSHPYDFSFEIVNVMKKYKNILPYLHLPVQSGDDEILKIMGRKYTSQEYLKIVKYVRKELPEISISTDIIVGFPKETDAQFSNTLKLVKTAKYDSAFTFIYSPRSGTPASRIKDNVSYQDKIKRFKKLNELLKEQMSKSNLKLIDHTFDVLVDGISKTDKTMLTGRLPNNKIVNFKGNKKLIGKIVKVKIKEEHIYFLMGLLEK